ncbi:MAG: hypothetical protein FWF51_11355 [Chitinivibrionia bacterium]|nr:hypothetical protein [Chitinivibrionia bacterium]
MSDDSANIRTCKWCGRPFKVGFFLPSLAFVFRDHRYCSQACHKMAYESDPEGVGREDRYHKTKNSVALKTGIVMALILIPLNYYILSTSTNEQSTSDPLSSSLIVGVIGMYIGWGWLGPILGAIIGFFKK